MRTVERNGGPRIERAVSVPEQGSAIVEVLPVGIVISEAETGRVLQVNDAFARMFGLDRRALDGTTCLELGIWEDLPELRDLVRRALERRAIQGEETWCRDGRGRRVRALLSCNRVELEGSDCLLWSVQDVTERLKSEREAWEGRELLARVVETMNESVAVLDLEGRITFANRIAEQAAGSADVTIVGRSYHDSGWRLTAVDGTELPDEELPFRRVLATGEPVTGAELAVDVGDGERMLVSINAAPLHDADGEMTGVVISTRDITRRRREERWRHLLESAVEATAHGIVITDRAGTIVWANPAMTEMTGYERRELLGASPRLLQSGQQDEAYYRELWQTVMGGEVWEGDLVNRRKDGSLYDERQSIVPVRHGSDEITHFVAVKEDVSEQRRLEERLRHQALHDPLTGLPNRRLLEERLERVLARTRRDSELCALLMVDLDRFKRVNDSLGHTGGDRVLQQVARRLREGVREEDTVARWGGDEFCVLLTGLEDRDALTDTWRRLHERIRQPLRVEGRELAVETTAGAVVAGSAGTADAVAGSAADLIRYAAWALQRAKVRAGTTLHYFQSERDAASEQFSYLDREQDLRRALAAGEIEPFYQPIVDLKTGTVVAVEALARWRHPERGLISPAEFIPLAEETDLIHELGRAILLRASGQVAEWNRRLGHPVKLAPNISGRQFEADGFTDQVREILELSGLAPELVALEITETAIMRATSRIRELRTLGVTLWVDDFGTGYSSLLYLRDLDVDGLKIDRSFVSGLGKSTGDRAIVETTLTLGRKLDLEVVAEGIETLGQLRRLRSLGCALGQGYLLARPVPAAEMGELLEGAGDPPCLRAADARSCPAASP